MRILLLLILIVLTSNSFAQDIYGCTQEGYHNYSPEATIDDYSCYYFGDYTGDGEVTGADLSSFFAFVGISYDISEYTYEGDYNVDGFITVMDVAAFLSVYGVNYDED